MAGRRGTWVHGRGTAWAASHPAPSKSGAVRGRGSLLPSSKEPLRGGIIQQPPSSLNQAPPQPATTRPLLDGGFGVPQPPTHPPTPCPPSIPARGYPHARSLA